MGIEKNSKGADKTTGSGRSLGAGAGVLMMGMVAATGAEAQDAAGVHIEAEQPRAEQAGAGYEHGSLAADFNAVGEQAGAAVATLEKSLADHQAAVDTSLAQAEKLSGLGISGSGAYEELSKVLTQEAEIGALLTGAMEEYSKLRNKYLEDVRFSETASSDILVGGWEDGEELARENLTDLYDSIQAGQQALNTVREARFAMEDTARAALPEITAGDYNLNVPGVANPFEEAVPTVPAEEGPDNVSIAAEAPPADSPVENLEAPAEVSELQSALEAAGKLKQNIAEVYDLAYDQSVNWVLQEGSAIDVKAMNKQIDTLRMNAGMLNERVQELQGVIDAHQTFMEQVNGLPGGVDGITAGEKQELERMQRSFDNLKDSIGRYVDIHQAGVENLNEIAPQTSEKTATALDELGALQQLKERKLGETP